MKYMRLETHEKSLTVYPLVCWHLGSRQCDFPFIREHVQRIAADPNGRWVYLGDGGECTTKVSKGELYEQRLSPDEQIDALVELLEPVRGQGLFGISGNHDRRIAKSSGLDWTHALCSRLGIPYLGLSAFLDIQFARGHIEGCVPLSKLNYHCFFHHGVDSSSVLGGKVNAAKKLDALVEADAVFSAHSHICADLPPTYVARIVQRQIVYRECRSFVCGCAYDSRVPGYAEEKAYSPVLPAHLGVTFYKHVSGRKTSSEQRRIDCQIWRAAL